MAEYIEREAVLADELTHCLPYSVGKAAGRVVVFVSDIEAIPAAEVVPVVHGWWEHLEQGWIDLWRCSACGDEWTFEYDPTDSETKVNYCPNCGAHMKDGAEC